MFGRDTDNSTDNNDQSHLAPAADPTDLSISAAEIAAAGKIGSVSSGTSGGFSGGSLNAALAGADQPLAPASSAPMLQPDPVVSPTAPSDTPDDVLQSDDEPFSVPGRTMATATDESAMLTKASEPVAPAAPTTPTAKPADDTAPSLSLQTSMSSSDDMEEIKKQALQQLSPLVSRLDLSPEEKFQTTMQLLQTTEDKSLIKTAYEAAQAIKDEKVKAHALLDVVNEINYFEQKDKPAA